MEILIQRDYYIRLLLFLIFNTLDTQWEQKDDYYLNISNNVATVPFSECVNTFYNNFGNNQNQHEFIYNYLIPTMSEILADIKDLLVDSQTNANLQNIGIANSQGYSPWSWNDFYNNQALDGLQNCSFFQAEIATIGSNGYPINIVNNNKWIIWTEYRTKSRLYLNNNCN